MLCGQVTLPDHHRALVWEWLIQWPQDTPPGSAEEEEELGGPADQRLTFEEVELRNRVLQPSIFDCYGTWLGRICWNCCRRHLNVFFFFRNFL